MSIVFCKKCGKNIPNDSDFCPHCGQSIEKVNIKTGDLASDNKNNTDNEIGTKRKIIGIAIAVIILLLLGIGIHHYKQEQTNSSSEVSTQTEKDTTEKRGDSDTGSNIIVDQNSLPLLWSAHIKDNVNAIPMVEEKNLDDLYFKIPSGDHITLSENRNIIVEGEPSVKYRISVINMEKEYPKELAQFSKKQVSEFADEFISIYHRNRSMANFMRGEITRFNKNNVYMLSLEAFVPDTNDIRYKTSFYIMYHDGICYAVEINEGMREYDITLANVASYAFLDNIRYR